MAIAIILAPSKLVSSGGSLESAVSTLTLCESHGTLGNTLEILAKDEVELRALAREARLSADRTLKKLDETIAHVDHALRARRSAN
jgi:hypothetical protein